MKQIYELAVEAIRVGIHVKIDFPQRTLAIAGHKYIDHGKVEEGFTADNFDIPPTTPSILSHIEDLYANYKHSIPSAYTDARRHQYFKALPESELSNDDMLYGMPRDAAQFSLEYYILECLIKGHLVWDDELMGGHWFWQSKEDSDLILLRTWIES